MADKLIDVLKQAIAEGRNFSDLVQSGEVEIADSEQAQIEGLRNKPKGTTMVFPESVGPFNTKGMNYKIDIDKYDDQGHLVQSYRNVPPGIENIPMGPKTGTVIETPSENETVAKTGGAVKFQTEGVLNDKEWEKIISKWNRLTTRETEGKKLSPKQKAWLEATLQKYPDKFEFQGTLDEYLEHQKKQSSMDTVDVVDKSPGRGVFTEITEEVNEQITKWESDAQKQRVLNEYKQAHGIELTDAEYETIKNEAIANLKGPSFSRSKDDYFAVNVSSDDMSYILNTDDNMIGHGAMVGNKMSFDSDLSLKFDLEGERGAILFNHSSWTNPGSHPSKGMLGDQFGMQYNLETWGQGDGSGVIPSSSLVMTKFNPATNKFNPFTKTNIAAEGEKPLWHLEYDTDTEYPSMWRKHLSRHEVGHRINSGGMTTDAFNTSNPELETELQDYTNTFFEFAPMNNKFGYHASVTNPEHYKYQTSVPEVKSEKAALEFALEDSNIWSPTEGAFTSAHLRQLVETANPLYIPTGSDHFGGGLSTNIDNLFGFEHIKSVGQDPRAMGSGWELMHIPPESELLSGLGLNNIIVAQNDMLNVQNGFLPSEIANKGENLEDLQSEFGDVEWQLSGNDPLMTQEALGNVVQWGESPEGSEFKISQTLDLLNQRGQVSERLNPEFYTNPTNYNFTKKEAKAMAEELGVDFKTYFIKGKKDEEWEERGYGGNYYYSELAAQDMVEQYKNSSDAAWLRNLEYTKSDDWFVPTSEVDYGDNVYERYRLMSSIREKIEDNGWSKEEAIKNLGLPADFDFEQTEKEIPTFELATIKADKKINERYQKFGNNALPVGERGIHGNIGNALNRVNRMMGTGGNIQDLTKLPVLDFIEWKKGNDVVNSDGQIISGYVEGSNDNQFWSDDITNIDSYFLEHWNKDKALPGKETRLREKYSKKIWGDDKEALIREMEAAYMNPIVETIEELSDLTTDTYRRKNFNLLFTETYGNNSEVMDALERIHGHNNTIREHYKIRQEDKENFIKEEFYNKKGNLKWRYRKDKFNLNQLNPFYKDEYQKRNQKSRKGRDRAYKPWHSDDYDNTTKKFREKKDMVESIFTYGDHSFEEMGIDINDALLKDLQIVQNAYTEVYKLGQKKMQDQTEEYYNETEEYYENWKDPKFQQEMNNWKKEQYENSLEGEDNNIIEFMNNFWSSNDGYEDPEKEYGGEPQFETAQVKEGGPIEFKKGGKKKKRKEDNRNTSSRQKPSMVSTDDEKRKYWLEMNTNKNFVQRILNPELNRGREIANPIDGLPMTHYMTHINNIVFPMVVDSGQGQFHHFQSTEEAYQYAMQSGEYIQTDSEEEARWLVKNYKTEEFNIAYGNPKYKFGGEHKPRFRMPKSFKYGGITKFQTKGVVEDKDEDEYVLGTNKSDGQIAGPLYTTDNMKSDYTDEVLLSYLIDQALINAGIDMEDSEAVNKGRERVIYAMNRIARNESQYSPKQNTDGTLQYDEVGDILHDGDTAALGIYQIKVPSNIHPQELVDEDGNKTGKWGKGPIIERMYKSAAQNYEFYKKLGLINEKNEPGNKYQHTFVNELLEHNDPRKLTKTQQDLMFLTSMMYGPAPFNAYLTSSEDNYEQALQDLYFKGWHASEVELGTLKKGDEDYDEKAEQLKKDKKNWKEINKVFDNENYKNIKVGIHDDYDENFGEEDKKEKEEEIKKTKKRFGGTVKYQNQGFINNNDIYTRHDNVGSQSQFRSLDVPKIDKLELNNIEKEIQALEISLDKKRNNIENRFFSVTNIFPHIQKWKRLFQGNDLVDANVIVALEELAEIYPEFTSLDLQLTSALRSPEFNSKIGGRSYSRHQWGMALDFIGRDAKTLTKYLLSNDPAIVAWRKKWTSDKNGHMGRGVVNEWDGKHPHLHLQFVDHLGTGANFKNWQAGNYTTLNNYLKDGKYNTGLPKDQKQIDVLGVWSKFKEHASNSVYENASFVSDIKAALVEQGFTNEVVNTVKLDPNNLTGAYVGGKWMSDSQIFAPIINWDDDDNNNNQNISTGSSYTDPTDMVEQHQNIIRFDPDSMEEDDDKDWRDDELLIDVYGDKDEEDEESDYTLLGNISNTRSTPAFQSSQYNSFLDSENSIFLPYQSPFGSGKKPPQLYGFDDPEFMQLAVREQERKKKKKEEENNEENNDQLLNLG